MEANYGRTIREVMGGAFSVCRNLFSLDAYFLFSHLTLHEFFSCILQPPITFLMVRPLGLPSKNEEKFLLYLSTSKGKLCLWSQNEPNLFNINSP